EVKVFKNPSDVTYANGVFSNYAVMSYAANFQVFGNPPVSWTVAQVDPNYNVPGGGVLYRGSPNFSSSFADGASTTLMFSEKNAQCYLNGSIGNPKSASVWGFSPSTIGETGAYPMFAFSCQFLF